ncbi:MAG: MarC family protein [Sedimentisphaerales bacterium]|nr:MarC family protein [Sedimentisphaerales bacterium]
MPWKDLLSTFVPLFVAVDAVGILPLFMTLTEGMDKADKQRTVKQSLITALLVAVAFIFLGKSVFRLMGITVYDFMVAGGFLLFIIATLDLASGQKYARRIDTLGVVPLGVPLIVGPAVLTTSLMMVSVYGLGLTVLSLVLNIILAGAILLTSDFWARLLGRPGSQAVSKVASLILASIAVMMIRKGLSQIILDFQAANPNN